MLVLRDLVFGANGLQYAAGHLNSQFALARFKSDGTFDESFGTNGIVSGFGGTDADAILLASNGDLILAGYQASMPVAVARLNSAGEINNAFSTDGYTTFDFYPNNVGMSLKELKDGRILVSAITNNSGYFFDGGGSTSVGTAILKADGILDDSFDIDGKLVVETTALPWWSHASTQYFNGVEKILIGGSRFVDGKTDFFVTRTDLSGAIDSTFGISGTASVTIPNSFEQCTSMIVDANNKIYLTGSVADSAAFFDNVAYSAPTQEDFFIARLNANGTLDSTYGAGGIVTTDFGLRDISLASTVQDDGKLVLAGQSSYYIGGDTPYLYLARYTTSGKLDSTFGNNGRVSIVVDLTDMLWFEVTDVTYNKSNIYVTWTSGVTSASLKFDQSGKLVSGHFVGTDTSDKFFGSDVSDLLIGLTGDDIVDGGIGNDVIIGGEGNDTIVGGEGSDTASYTDATDGVLIDLFSGSVGSLGLDAGIGTDSLTSIENAIGSSSADQIIGSSGDNTVNAGGGNDVIQTGDGNDIVDAGSGDDLIIGGDGKGNDTYKGGIGIDTVKYTSATAGISVDLLKGSAKSLVNDNAAIGIDKLLEIENVISGDYGDVVVGSKTANVLHGMNGNDKITGGLGADQFIFETALDALNNLDTLLDFSSKQQDKIVLDDDIFSCFNATVSSTVSNGNLITVTNKTAGTYAYQADDYLIFNSTSKKLYYDADGAGGSAPIEFVILTGVKSLASDDFVIVA